MAKLTLVTETISPDEKAYRLAELDLTPHTASKGGRKFTPPSLEGRHRYQILWVNRGDNLVEHITDMGLSKSFAYPQINIPSFWEHTVAELRELANQVRSGGEWERDIITTRQQENNLMEKFLIQRERQRNALVGRRRF